MYTLKVEHSFDSAHFLYGYEGKCRNIHGHRWKVEVEIKAENLIQSGQLRGMVAYIGDSDVDVLTARNAGVDCIAVSWGFRDKGVLIKAGADKIADNIQVLKAELL